MGYELNSRSKSQYREQNDDCVPHQINRRLSLRTMGFITLVFKFIQEMGFVGWERNKIRLHPKNVSISFGSQRLSYAHEVSQVFNGAYSAFSADSIK